jgi:hypothetical protein
VRLSHDLRNTGHRGILSLIRKSENRIVKTTVLISRNRKLDVINLILLVNSFKLSKKRETKRTCSYGWKPSSAQEREFRLFANTHNIMDDTCLKILQDVDGKASSTCKHRISITAGITLKDRVAAPLN